jgi:nucleoid DNA-binding protein
MSNVNFKQDGTTTNRTDLVSNVQRVLQERGLYAISEDINEVIRATFEEISSTLKKGKAVRAAGFGMFYPKTIRAHKHYDGLEGRYYKMAKRVKLGFTSYDSGDRKLQRNRKR